MQTLGRTVIRSSWLKDTIIIFSHDDDDDDDEIIKFPVVVCMLNIYYLLVYGCHYIGIFCCFLLLILVCSSWIKPKSILVLCSLCSN